MEQNCTMLFNFLTSTQFANMVSLLLVIGNRASNMGLTLEEWNLFSSFLHLYGLFVSSTV